MTKEMNMMIMRFIERNMEENMSMAVTMYGYGDYVSGHTCIERVCTYGHTRKILLDGGTKEDIQKLADEYFNTGKSHIWFAYNDVAKEISSIEQFINCGLYKTNAEREAENQQWIFVGDRLPEIGEYVLCYLKGRHYFGHYRVCKYCAADKYVNHPYFDFNENGFPDVVAWMPLPKPAKFE